MNNGAKLICRRPSLSWTNQGLEGLPPASQPPCLTWGLLCQYAEQRPGWLRPLEHSAKDWPPWGRSEFPVLRALQPAAKRRGACPKEALCQMALELPFGISPVLEASLNKII